MDKVDEFHKHEVMDRASIIKEMLYVSLDGHPAMTPDLKVHYEKAFEALHGLYQAAGNEFFGDEVPVAQMSGDARFDESFEAEYTKHNGYVSSGDPWARDAKKSAREWAKWAWGAASHKNECDNPSNAATQDAPVHVPARYASEVEYLREKIKEKDTTIKAHRTYIERLKSEAAATVPQVVQSAQPEMQEIEIGGNGLFAGLKMIVDPNLPPDTIALRSGEEWMRVNLKTGLAAPSPVAVSTSVVPSDSILLDFLESNASVNFSFETASIEFELKDDLTYFNSIRDLLTIASNAGEADMKAILNCDDLCNVCAGNGCPDCNGTGEAKQGEES